MSEQARQYGVIRGEPTLYQKIEQVLIDAGFGPGAFHRRWGYESGSPSVPPIPGYVIGVSYIGEVYVDHAGSGRKNEIGRYLEALQAAGYPARLAPMEYRTKVVVWPGVWDERFSARRKADRNFCP